MGAPIQMRVWDNYVEIWNEGGLPIGYTPDTLMNKHSSRPRNKNIANAFFKAGFIESWGRGYEKIFEGFEAAGLPMPTIEEADGGVRVTFQRNNQGNPQTASPTDATETQQKTSQKTSQKTPQKILELIEGNPKITTHDMADVIGIDIRNIHRNIKKLQEQGVLRRVGPDKGGHWEIQR